MQNFRPAAIFAIAAHDALGQKRKYSGDPYWKHPQAVAQILIYHGHGDDKDLIDAAWLHDVPEDTDVSIQTIEDLFGPVTGLYVDGMTKRKYPGQRRAYRKNAEASRIAGCCAKVKTLKIADSLHNLPDIIEHDPKFARVYVPEKRHLLDTALVGGDPVLWAKLDAIIRDYYTKNA